VNGINNTKLYIAQQVDSNYKPKQSYKHAFPHRRTHHNLVTFIVDLLCEVLSSIEGELKKSKVTAHLYWNSHAICVSGLVLIVQDIFHFVHGNTDRLTHMHTH